MTRTLFFIIFIGNCYGSGIYSPNAKAGVDQCCSGEGLLALSSYFLATKQLISTTPFNMILIS